MQSDIAPGTEHLSHDDRCIDELAGRRADLRTGPIGHNGIREGVANFNSDDIPQSNPRERARYDLFKNDVYRALRAGFGHRCVSPPSTVSD
jgi:hypothetical protein